VNFKQFNSYLLSKKGASFDYPFDEKVRVYRVGEKMFALIVEENPLKVNLKCDPIYALELRSIYESVKAGYHMNKKHWNTITLEESDIDNKSIYELIDHSYNLVFKSLTKKRQVQIEELSLKN
jgi:predicted DNA-binding protein (MmcQ/YjbR family)